MSLTDHYGQGGELEQRLLARLAAAGLDPDALAVEDLAGADEFHLGGRAATETILSVLELTGTERVFDIGCGLGGPARHVASSTGCRVHGVDLTREFVEVAATLSERTGLTDRTTFECRDVELDGLPDGAFDVVTIFHVGMNIADKQALAAAASERLAAGGRLVVYDIMRIGSGDLEWPMPWSATDSTSFVESPEHYLDAMEAARGDRTTRPPSAGPRCARRGRGVTADVDPARSDGRWIPDHDRQPASGSR